MDFADKGLEFHLAYIDMGPFTEQSPVKVNQLRLSHKIVSIVLMCRVRIVSLLYLLVS